MRWGNLCRNSVKILAVLLCVFSLAACKSTRQMNRAIKSKDSEAQYRLAEEFFTNKKYSNAQTLYENVMPALRSDPRYNEMVYKYGMCSFYQEDYHTAISVFKNMLDNIPNFPRKEEISFLIIVSYNVLSEPYFHEQVNTNFAINEAQQFVSFFPQSGYVDSCYKIIAKCRSVLEEKAYSAAIMYYKMGFYKSSLLEFQSLQLNFPETSNADKYEYYKILSASEVLKATIIEKKQQREQELLDYCINFQNQYPDSKYIREVERIQTNVNLRENM